MPKCTSRHCHAALLSALAPHQSSRNFICLMPRFHDYVEAYQLQSILMACSLFHYFSLIDDSHTFTRYRTAMMIITSAVTDFIGVTYYIKAAFYWLLMIFTLHTYNGRPHSRFAFCRPSHFHRPSRALLARVVILRTALRLLFSGFKRPLRFILRTKIRQKDYSLL